MWRTVYKKRYKTSKPNLIITAVCSFPNTVDTVDKAIVSYRVKEFQKDPTLLAIESDYWYNNGRNFLPLYFEDDCPKLSKLQNIMPLGKGFFWCIGYKNPNYTEIRNTGCGSYNPPSHEQYKEWLKYWFNTHSKIDKYDGIVLHLFKNCVKRYVYETSNNFSDQLKSRRFDVMENKYFVVEYFDDKSDYFSFLEEMYNMNWYEFVFKFFK